MQVISAGEGKFSFLQWSDIEFINHIPGQASCLEVVLRQGERERERQRVGEEGREEGGRRKGRKIGKKSEKNIWYYIK